MSDQRPRDLSPPELGFERQSPVPWLSPPLLAGTALRVVLAELFGAYLDKRELQAVMPSMVYEHNDGDELWIDYIADVGDGFNATYTLAYALAQPTISVERADGSTVDLPRGDILILGGDQVYPVASARAYENRWKGPYRAALPKPGDKRRTIYALPGNHDWYDGLTAFLRIFAQGDPIGGWQTRQDRSYFALALPHGWWLYAIDAQFDAYLDEPQLRYFEDAAERLRAGDRVILCAARPTWVVAQRTPDAYDTIDYFVRTVLEPRRVAVDVMLAGDAHHYARYVSERVATHEEANADGDRPEDSTVPAEGRQLITCGGGGAYLMGTEALPETILVPPAGTISRSSSRPIAYRLAGAYPSAKRSRRLGWGVFARLPRRNPGFVALLGLLQTLLMLALLTGHDRWINVPIIVMVAAIFVGTIAFAMPQPLRSGRPVHWLAGILHGPPHLALGLVGAWVWSDLPFVDAPRPWSVLLAFLLYWPVAGLLDTWVLGAYLIVASRFRINVNELYAGQAIEDYKSFLRLHIDREGMLTIYPIAVDRVVRRWRADPSGAPHAPWIVPTEPIRLRFAELPITLERQPTAVGRAEARSE